MTTAKQISYAAGARIPWPISDFDPRLPDRLLRPESSTRDRLGRDLDSISQTSRASQKKPYQVLVANYGSFYLRMGAVCKLIYVNGC